jgi:hypothetical protein
LGDLEALMADYRAMATAGWAAAAREGGAEALLSGSLPGRFMHFSAGELRMREVRALLEDYKVLAAGAAEIEGPEVEHGRATEEANAEERGPGSAGSQGAVAGTAAAGAQQS